MLANFIICQACGCQGRAGNTLSRNQSESPVFSYLGHDPFEGIMRYLCASCHTTLRVDPMDMLAGFCAKGVPERTGQTINRNHKTRLILSTGGIVRIIPRKIPALKYH